MPLNFELCSYCACPLVCIWGWLYNSNDKDVMPSLSCGRLIVIILRLWHKFWPHNVCALGLERKKEQYKVVAVHSGLIDGMGWNDAVM
jgi:hypothetical protein